jgi:hypothetical protein
MAGADKTARRGTREGLDKESGIFDRGIQTSLHEQRRDRGDMVSGVKRFRVEQ